jgi:hypothetical protein
VISSDAGDVLLDQEADGFFRKAAVIHEIPGANRSVTSEALDLHQRVSKRMHVGVKVGEDGETFHGPLAGPARLCSIVATERPLRSVFEILLPESTRVSDRNLLQEATPRALP